MEMIRHFEHLGRGDTAIAGGKGASLGEMTGAGIPVPLGFVVLVGAFEQFLAETDLNVEIEAILHTIDVKEMHTVEYASEKIQRLILEAKIPIDIASKIETYFKKLDTQYVAVRSSATAEDSASTAWAGQLDSYLNTTEDTLLKNVQRCWASLFTPRAIFYRFEKELHAQKIFVAVVVQKMIQSEKSGIAFSVHPVTEDRNQLIIEAGWGLGEAIVSGQVTPNSYVVEKEPRRIIDKNISTQTRALYRKTEMSDISVFQANEWRDIPEPKASSQVLSDEEILELSKLILKIEDHYGFPCDIEWAYEGGKFYITQSRPITTLSNDAPPSVSFPHNLNPKDYQYSWGGKGFSLLFQSIFGNALSHLPFFDSFCISFNKELRVYWAYTALEEAEDYGTRLFSNLSSAKKQCEKITQLADAIEDYQNVKDIDTAVLNRFLMDAEDFLLEYMTLDPEFTDKLLSQSGDLELLHYLGQQKNNFRERINHVFFNEDSILASVLTLISTKTGILAEHLQSYSIEELKKVLSGEVFRPDERRNFIVLTKADSVQYCFDNEIISKVWAVFSEQRDHLDELYGTSVAKKGIFRGKVKKLDMDYEQLSTTIAKLNMEEGGNVFVADHTTPELLPIMKRSVAIITDMGGILSHAAITSRELDIPCIIGTKIATQVLKDGDLVEVDADAGVVRILERAT